MLQINIIFIINYLHKTTCLFSNQCNSIITILLQKQYTQYFSLRKGFFFLGSLHVIFPFARACFPLKRIDSRDYPCNLSTAFHLLLRVDRSFEDIPCSWWTRAANAFLWIIAPLTWVIAPAGKLYSNLFTADRIRREFYILSFAREREGGNEAG